MKHFDTLSGKISLQNFKELVHPQLGASRKEVMVGSAFGVDTSVISLGNNRVMAVSSDPLSLIPSLGLKESAWLSVHLLVNDMATTGFSPQYAQFVLNLPTELSEQDFTVYWNYIHSFCKEVGVAITGGHTGKIEGQHSTISGGGTMFLQAPEDKVLTSNNARQGDRIVVTKESALTATSILARSFPETTKRAVGDELFQTACDNFYRTSSLKEALTAVKCLVPNKELHAMHDVTEGGILGAIYEMAQASGLGFEVEKAYIPVSDAVRSVAELFQLDATECIGAGSMVMSVAAGKEDQLISALRAENIPATVVGCFKNETFGCQLNIGGQKEAFTYSSSDPYWAAFFNAIKKEWK